MAQPMLPFEGSALDTPIAYGLTARARRLVASATLPDLTVLPGTGEDRSEANRFDTRPARARALRRSGRNLREIADELEVGEEVAAAWTRDIRRGPLRSRSRRSTSPLRHMGDAVAAALEPRTAQADGDLAAAGLVLGLAEVTPHAITIQTADPAVARTVVNWLQGRMGVPAPRLRMLLAVGPAVARDLAAHRWAEMVGIPLENVLAAPWPQASEPTAVRGTLRVADARVAAMVTNWRATLLAGELPAPDAGDRERSGLACTSLPSATG
ncbi:MAG: hypothetical protein M3O70_00790 [Actinomycetota bacterium]|nr:hypothetical protein [Actinomycetota bacterium]